MQRRHQFGQHERARRNIQALAFAGARAEQNRRIHAGECEQHTDDPEPDRHTAVEILHRDQRCQSGRTDDDRPSERHATIRHRDIHHARGPFADRRIRTGDVGQSVGDWRHRRYRKHGHQNGRYGRGASCQSSCQSGQRIRQYHAGHLPPPI